jgi:hypothetical protein
VYTHAQRKKNKFESGGVIELNDSPTTYGQSDIFNFPNINKFPFYKEGKYPDPDGRLERSLALDELYNALKIYVSNFGPENFPASTPLIWKLAKLSGKYGPPGESILLYKLVLKHYRKNTDITKCGRSSAASSTGIELCSA